MTIELGILDIDGFVELMGNNSELFEALFDAYLPEALDEALPSSSSPQLFDYDIRIPNDVKKYIDSQRHDKQLPKSERTPKEKGTEIVNNVLKSAILLPILLLFSFGTLRDKICSKTAASPMDSFKHSSLSKLVSSAC